MITLPGKRILMFNWRDTKHKHAGGAEIYANELAKRWVAMGYEVTMFCGSDGQSPRYEDIDGIHIVRRGSFNAVYLWAAIHYVTRFRGHFDVIVDCHNGIPFFTPLFSRLPIYCVVHHVHQDVFKQFLSAPAALLAQFLEKTAMPFIYRNRQYITVSDSSKSAMVSELGIKAEQIEIVHNGVNLLDYTPGTKSAVPTVLYIGRLKAYKSVDVLINAFAEVVSRQAEAKLVIGGTGDAEPDLRALVQELGISGSVQFLGRVSDADKIQLMQQAWVFCNPSFAEGWGITTIETNACGTPVIASDVPGLRDSVSPDAGFLVPYADAGAFADKISSILDDASLRSRMSQNAVRWAQNFSWQNSADKLLRIISPGQIPTAK